MSRYTVNHAYSAFRDGVRFGPWSAGETVELSDFDAEWLLRDSPGVVTERVTVRAKAPARNRQQVARKNRSE